MQKGSSLVESSRAFEHDIAPNNKPMIAVLNGRSEIIFVGIQMDWLFLCLL
ncbi:hypothetical protein HPP92_005864 [Vanilla planifolia]|uniref:Uncharacterized protein n=1 Tax=Vanilla planifolia TaxID=51239 RepID=A0A835RM70_VANPL|nr:hypothetical protein HPP92_005864 [Vanilla planifolia]